MTIFLTILIVANFFLTLYLLFLHSRRWRQSALPASGLEALSALPVKIRLVKFNPFPGVGGEQSFILCLLDAANSGVIITSLHTPSQTRTYAKPVVEGKADGVSLSPQEAAFLKQVINS